MEMTMETLGVDDPGMRGGRELTEASGGPVPGKRRPFLAEPLSYDFVSLTADQAVEIAMTAWAKAASSGAEPVRAPRPRGGPSCAERAGATCHGAQIGNC